jgi:hypothetical protein
MATLAELYDARNNSSLRNKITSAVAIAAEAIRLENVNTLNHVNRLIWARQAFANPAGVAEDVMWAVLAANESATAAQIAAVSDASIKAAVNAAVDVFATGA